MEKLPFKKLYQVIEVIEKFVIFSSTNISILQLEMFEQNLAIDSAQK